MTVFEYVTALLAIVLGLSIARVMGGIGTFIVAEQRTMRDWLIAGWCVALTLTQVGWWLLMWTLLSDAQTITLATILAWVVATALLFLASHTLIPGTPVSPDSQTPILWALRASFFICLAGHFTIPFLSAVLAGNFAAPNFLVLLLVVLSATGAYLKSDRAHLALLVAWMITMSVTAALAVPSVGDARSVVFESPGSLLSPER